MPMQPSIQDHIFAALLDTVSISKDLRAQSDLVKRTYDDLVTDRMDLLQCVLGEHGCAYTKQSANQDAHGNL